MRVLYPYIKINHPTLKCFECSLTILLVKHQCEVCPLLQIEVYVKVLL